MKSDDLYNSPNEDDVKYCYRLLLGRNPDKGDWKAYTTAIRSGWTIETLVRSFLSSLEFKNRRLPNIQDSPELAKDTMKLDGFNHAANEDDVKYCYRLLLGRNPDKEGWETYTAFVRKGWSIEHLVKTFLLSQEFRNRGLSKTLEPSKLELIHMKERFRLYIYSNDDVIGGCIRSTKEFEPHVTRMMKSELFTGATFLDIGANVGYYSILAAKLVGPEGRVFSFEPFQPNVNLIYLNTKINKVENVYIYPFALAEKRSAFVAYTVDTNAGLLEFSGEIDDFCSRDIVYSATLDELLAGIDKVDIIKIDIEGFEYRALKGGVNVIQKHRPIIFSELLPDALKMASNITTEKYLKFIKDKNYVISVISEEGKKIDCANDIKRIMDYFYEQEGDHIDIVAYPE